jgi:hypothetical protein
LITQEIETHEKIELEAVDSGGRVVQTARLVKESAMDRDYEVTVPAGQSLTLRIGKNKLNLEDLNGRRLTGSPATLPLTPPKAGGGVITIKVAGTK